MNNTELVYEGVNLMLTGMGFTFCFLLLLIFSISVMSKLVNRFFPETTALPTPAPTISQVDEISDLRPVIIAAIAHHRRQQGLQH